MGRKEEIDIRKRMVADRIAEAKRKEAQRKDLVARQMREREELRKSQRG